MKIVSHTINAAHVLHEGGKLRKVGQQVIIQKMCQIEMVEQAKVTIMWHVARQKAAPVTIKDTFEIIKARR